MVVKARPDNQKPPRGGHRPSRAAKRLTPDQQRLRKALGGVLRDARDRLGLSQEEAAARMPRMSQFQLSQRESGICGIDVTELAIFGEAYKVQPLVLLSMAIARAEHFAQQARQRRKHGRGAADA